jgi:histidinol-phosphate aminotransferase
MMKAFQTDDDFLENINPAVREMSAYKVDGGQTASVKLNQNENPFDLPSWLKLEILNEFYKENWNRYPDIFPNEAITRYAKFLGVPKDCVMMGNGSNELIYTIFLATVRKSASVLIPSPTFSLYEKVAALTEASVIKIGMTDELKFRVGDIIEEAERSRPNLIVLSTANNPTAQSMTLEDIERIAAETQALVLVDEAYHEFSKQRSALELIENYSNVIVLRTMSKAFAMAGLRVGFAVSNPALTAELLKPKIPFASSRLAEIAVIKVLDNYHVVKETIDTILKERDRMTTAFRDIPKLKLYESDANFFVIEVEAPKEIFEALKSNGILVRSVAAYPQLEKCLRVGIGTPDENDKLLGELKKLLS